MKRRLLCLIAIGVLAAGPVAAATFVAMTPPDLVRDSDAVIEGRVIHLESFWDEAGRMIVTEATVLVTETLIGNSASVLTVRTPGGTVAGFTVSAEGFPQLSLEERVILFLDRDLALQTNRIVGHQQGHYEIVERLDGVELAVPRVEDGARFFTRSGQLLAAARSMELGEFKAGLRELAERTGRIER